MEPIPLKCFSCHPPGVKKRADEGTRSRCEARMTRMVRLVVVFWRDFVSQIVVREQERRSYIWVVEKREASTFGGRMCETVGCFSNIQRLFLPHVCLYHQLTFDQRLTYNKYQHCFRHFPVENYGAKFQYDTIVLFNSFILFSVFFRVSLILTLILILIQDLQQGTHFQFALSIRCVLSVTAEMHTDSAITKNP